MTTPPDKTAQKIASIRAMVVGESDIAKKPSRAANKNKLKGTQKKSKKTNARQAKEAYAPQTPTLKQRPSSSKPTPPVMVQVQSQSPEPDTASPKLPDPVALAQSLLKLSERTQPIINAWLEKIKLKPNDFCSYSFHQAADLWLQLLQKTAERPTALIDAQLGLWRDYSQLWQNTYRRLMGESSTSVINPQEHDKRFKDAAWSENTLFDFIKQSYLLSARFLQQRNSQISGVDAATQRKIDFYTRQFVDALSPTNFALTNPEVLRQTLESGGENLVKGLEHLLNDLERGRGELLISMTDTNAFKLGENIATTPGKVVFQNDLMQLIMYAPATATVAKTPLLIIPPWINKYYILDLRPTNSFVRWCVEQGQTVFMISWVNPDARHRDKNFEHYMLEGPLAALQHIKTVTGEKQANVVGYCLGGTLLACTLAYLQRTAPHPHRAAIASATYLVTLVDFKNCGDIGVFIDEEQVAAVEAGMAETGYLDAGALAAGFNLLRNNDLIWNFVINNYLLGRDPFPFDLLYWNSDGTRLPYAMHSFYLRNMYLYNKLVQPNGVTLDGVPIDLRSITTPSFMLSTRDDHIAPWQATYAGTQLYQGQNKFVLSSSGHIAGVINPPTSKKYSYWTNDVLPADPDVWLANAKPHQGSWWPEWMAWLQTFAGQKVPARTLDHLTALEDAPGSYVKQRAF